MGDSPYLVERMQGFGTTIFAEMSALAVATGSINLGQGFPDEDGPRRGARRRRRRHPRPATTSTRPGSGSPSCATRSPRTRRSGGRSSTTPTPRCSSPRAPPRRSRPSLLALCEPGSDVVTFEPYYDSYAACIALAGAHRRVVQLRTPDWSFDADALERAITPEHACAAPQLAAQPDRQGVLGRGARADRAPVRGARPDRDHRRGLRAPRLRRSARAARHHAGHARPHGDDLVGRQDASRARGGRSAGSAHRPTSSTR